MLEIIFSPMHTVISFWNGTGCRHQAASRDSIVLLDLDQPDFDG